MSLTHLAPFVDISRQKIRKSLKEELTGVDISDEQFDAIVESRVRKEISAGVQTIQYQVSTIASSNG